jgi:hypothetical protein
MTRALPRAGSKPYNFRLPPVAYEYLEEQAQSGERSKTEVVVEALACLRERQREALMAEGYRELAVWNRELAEGTLSAGNEALPE